MTRLAAFALCALLAQRAPLDPRRELERFALARRAAIESYLAGLEAIPYRRREVAELRARVKRVTGRDGTGGLVAYLCHGVEELVRQKEAALRRPLTREERAEAFDDARTALLDLLERRRERGNALLSRAGPLSVGR